MIEITFRIYENKQGDIHEGFYGEETNIVPTPTDKFIYRTVDVFNTKNLTDLSVSLNKKLSKNERALFQTYKVV